MTARNEFWIPDSEVHEKKASPTSRGKKYEETREHSGKIVRSIEGIGHSLECYATDNDNIDVLMVIETRKHGDIREPLEKNGMDQQYRFSDTECLASMSMDSFHKMADNARRYDSSFDEPKRRYVSKFNHVVDLSPNTDAKRKIAGGSGRTAMRIGGLSEATSRCSTAIRSTGWTPIWIGSTSFWTGPVSPNGYP